MKRLSYFLISLGFFIIIYAQEETESFAYAFTYSMLDAEGHPKETAYIRPDKQKTNGKEEYTRFYKYGTMSDVSIFLRMEQEKVFWLDTESQKEYVIYDFGLKLGDSFTNTLDGMKYQVVDIRDTITKNENLYPPMVNSFPLTLMEMQRTDGKRETWVKGVGSLSYGILRPGMLKGINRLCLVEFEGLSDYCVLHCCPNNDYIKVAKADLTKLEWQGPTGVEYVDEIGKFYDKRELQAEFNGDTLHVWGQLPLNCLPNAYMGCEKDGNVLSLKYFNEILSVDCKGPFMLDIRFPGFASGRYIFEGKEIICEESHVSSIFRIENFLEEIQTPATDADNSAPLYDLSGRRLEQKPTKGIYIQGGRVMIQR